MDFFREQDRAKSRTFWLMCVFCVAISAIAILLFALAMTQMPEYFCQLPRAQIRGGGLRQRFCIDHFKWDQVIAFFSCVVGFLGMMSIYRYKQLASGGRVVAEAMGGRLLNTAQLTGKERQLVNVIEEMSIAAGIPVPLIYVIETPSINAFAAGTEPMNAVIGVTSGALQAFNRSEMQAVIGHEYSHILNGDMKLNMNLIGICYGLLGFFQVGRSLIRSAGRSSRKGGGQLALLGIALMIVGIIGYFFGIIIQAAVSRQREFLADASSVQFTRNPGSMSAALKKIASFGSVIHASNTNEVSHMFFADGLKRMVGSVFATHPPLLERIQKIEPNFRQSHLDQLLETTPPRVVAAEGVEISGQAGAAAFAGGMVVKRTVVEGPSPKELISSTGKVPNASEAAAVDLLASLDADLKTMAREPYGARAIVFALLINENHDASPALSEIIARSCGNDVVKLVDQTQLKLKGNEHIRLALLDLCMPSLRNLSIAQLHTFLETLQKLIETDKQVELFEFALFSVVKANLARNARLRISKSLPTISDGEAVARLIAAVVQGSKSSVEEPLGYMEIEIYRQFIQNFPSAQSFKDAVPTWDISRFEASLLRASAFSFKQKKFLLEQLAGVAAADDIVDVREVEIIRSIADRLSCPIPPNVQQARQIAVA